MFSPFFLNMLNALSTLFTSFSVSVSGVSSLQHENPLAPLTKPYITFTLFPFGTVQLLFQLS
ncbi:hypothetical protein HanRHA438_Chr00c03g0844521 [Helianthus annuus]|nr:hypothetical protein HanRHA438_Chr00c03g0844521 [Helianthus annuus]